MTYHNFNEKLAQGEQGERSLDEFFCRQYKITAATREQQRQGIDRVFEDLSDSYLVEYKTDRRAHATGNAFVETVSVAKQGEIIRLGWGYTSQAAWLFYFVPRNLVPAVGDIYQIELYLLRGMLPLWEKAFPAREVPNKDYFTRGLLVPFAELRKCCSAVHRIEER